MSCHLTIFDFVIYLLLIYPNELEVKDITDTQKSASYLELHPEIDNEGRLKTRLYDKLDDFTFQIINLPFIRSNIQAASSYGAYTSELIHFSGSCA